MRLGRYERSFSSSRVNPSGPRCSRSRARGDRRNPRERILWRCVILRTHHAASSVAKLREGATEIGGHAAPSSSSVADGPKSAPLRAVGPADGPTRPHISSVLAVGVEVDAAVV
jgi:hypothetical protein